MLHAHYVHVFPAWVYYFYMRAPQLFGSLSAENSLLQNFLKKHLAHDLAYALPGVGITLSQELLVFIKRKLTNRESGEQFSAAIENCA